MEKKKKGKREQKLPAERFGGDIFSHSVFLQVGQCQAKILAELRDSLKTQREENLGSEFAVALVTKNQTQSHDRLESAFSDLLSELGAELQFCHLDAV